VTSGVNISIYYIHTLTNADGAFGGICVIGLTEGFFGVPNGMIAIAEGQDAFGILADYPRLTERAEKLLIWFPVLLWFPGDQSKKL
jgi:hypothetical protein